MGVHKVLRLKGSEERWRQKIDRCPSRDVERLIHQCIQDLGSPNPGIFLVDGRNACRVNGHGAHNADKRRAQRFEAGLFARRVRAVASEGPDHLHHGSRRPRKDDADRPPSEVEHRRPRSGRDYAEHRCVPGLPPCRELALLSSHPH